MQRMANRIVTCCFCHNPSTNQFGTTPFNNLWQSLRWPTLFFHEMCGRDFQALLESEFDMPATSQFSRMFYAGAIYESDVTSNKETADEQQCFTFE